MPVKVIAGCRASGRTPDRAAGASTASPCAPEVCATTWPARHAPVSASPATSGGELVVRDGQQHQVGPGHDLVGGP